MTKSSSGGTPARSSSCDDLLTAAVGYARLGYRVLPLRDKRPVTTHGVYDATTEVEQVREWWSENPSHNVGLAVPQWYVVLDVDPRNGGVETARRLADELGALPATPTAETGSGGLHAWLRVPHAADELRGSLGQGVDVKKLGGYVVAPPSRTERQYRWLDQTDRVAVAPVAWVERLHRPLRPAVRVTPTPVTGKAADEHTRWWCAVLRHTTEGGRNHQLFLSAVRVAERQCLTADAERQLTEAAYEVGLEPLEVERTLRSAKEKFQ